MPAACSSFKCSSSLANSSVVANGVTMKLVGGVLNLLLKLSFADEVGREIDSGVKTSSVVIAGDTASVEKIGRLDDIANCDFVLAFLLTSSRLSFCNLLAAALLLLASRKSKNVVFEAFGGEFTPDNDKASLRS
ncbi:unnamed protein product [Didymodactylos carnosus]|uniref:Uncharacterized protein n=1 Tax=Didymodactylos carnosus TaxID=1234261 RepID=A0A8S2RG99_9BILA|nr:unnamed protein product [Didymodactylos carnosus]CAF4161069.1 unnamed protein product [Didymodactylos carnosus]